MERERVVVFLTEKKGVDRLLVKCPALERASAGELDFPGDESRYSRCPQLLLVSVWARLELMVLSLEGVGAELKHVATMVTSFPRTLLHSVQEKLCPLLAFLQDVGIKAYHLAKVNLSTLLKPWKHQTLVQNISLQSSKFRWY